MMSRTAFASSGNYVPQSHRRQSHRRTSQRATNPFDVFEERVVIAMVGLPARGKSYLSKAIVRYMNLFGCPTQLFNAGNLRRKQGLAGTDANFFDPKNEEGKAAREQMAMDCLTELLNWIKSTPSCSVGILDATNTTVARRKKLIQRIKEETDQSIKIVFLESYADDEELLEQNYRMKLSNDDYKGKNPEIALADFRKRVQQYEAVYEPITSENDGTEISFIKLINAGKKLESQNIIGFTERKIRHLLGTVHLEPRTIWLSLIGETEDDRLSILGGDSPLSVDGLKYCRACCDIIEDGVFKEGDAKNREEAHTIVYTGTYHRYMTAAKLLPIFGNDNLCANGNASKFVRKYKLLSRGAANDICEGNLDSMSYAEREKQFPYEASARKADKLNYRYPGVGGESYQDLIARCNELIYSLEQARGCSVVISDRAVYRVVMGYFMGNTIEEIPHLEVKPGVLELRRNEEGFSSTHFPVSVGKATSSAGPGYKY